MNRQDLERISFNDSKVLLKIFDIELLIYSSWWHWLEISGYSDKNIAVIISFKIILIKYKEIDLET